MKSFALSTSTQMHTALFHCYNDPHNQIACEAVIHRNKSTWVHAEWANIKNDGSVGGGRSRSGYGDSLKWAVRSEVRGSDVFRYWKDATQCPYKVFFVSRVWACPSCRRAEVEYIGEQLGVDSLEDAARQKVGIVGSPMVVAPCKWCCSDGLRDQRVRHFVKDLFSGLNTDVATEEDIGGILGYSREAMGAIVLSDCKAIFLQEGRPMVHVSAFCEWLARAWHRCAKRGEIQWMAEHYVPTRIAESPCEDGFIEASFSAQEPGVYILMQGTEVVYVGQSSNVARRIGAHVGDKAFDRAMYKPVAKSQLLTVEARFINKFAPIYNKTAPGFVANKAIPRCRTSLIAA
jgi:hypothetical protein